MRFFDTHAHLESEQLKHQRDHWLKLAAEAGVVAINSIGTDWESSRDCVDLADQYPQIYASVGVHPNYANEATEDDWQQICELAEHPRVIAIGETGLDLYWKDVPFDLQLVWFARHIELSFQLGKPLVIHMRDCEAELLKALTEHQEDGQINGIMHSFAGSWDTARQCLDWGMYLSFSGIVTYKKSDALREVAKKTPRDRILIETDAPYLAPDPYRKERPNHPAMVKHTAQCLADVLDIPLSDLGELTTNNAMNLFHI